MNNSVRNEREALKTELSDRLISLLPTLRTYLGISQQELAEYIGVTRQTYCALEQGKRKMAWSVFLSLFLFFYVNPKTRAIMEERPHFMNTTHRLLQYPEELLKEENVR